jgi:hypothetical protein
MRVSPRPTVTQYCAYSANRHCHPQPPRRACARVGDALHMGARSLTSSISGSVRGRPAPCDRAWPASSLRLSRYTLERDRSEFIFSVSDFFPRGAAVTSATHATRLASAWGSNTSRRACAAAVTLQLRTPAAAASRAMRRYSATWLHTTICLSC